MKKKKYVDTRNWKEYEKDLLERKRKVVKFFFTKPTKKELEEEILGMNKKKRGRKYEIPDSVLTFFHFMKSCFRIDDRILTMKLSLFLYEITGIEREFDHSAIVKRRQNMTFDIPFAITPEKINGKTIYGDGVCLRLGRGGYYRSKRYKTNVDFVKVVVFTDDKGKVLDFVIGDEHDAEVNMIREKMPEILESKPGMFNYDGSAASHDIISALVQNGIQPVIPASSASIKSNANAPPDESCIRKKSKEELIWNKYVGEQQNYEEWKAKTKYPMRWVFSEGRFSNLKRMFGEEVLTRTQKAIHDEVCIKMMTLDGVLPNLWG